MELVLDFERPLVELYKRIDSLQVMQEEDGTDMSASIDQLRGQAERLHRQIFSALTPWQRAQLSRHPRRPYTLDYIEHLFTEWSELRGDRAGHSDQSIVTGFARYKDRPVLVIGHQKGRNTKENISRNFGMPRPEGYRKALRLMELANRFNRPIITFIDTPGAYPGIDAEARGQAEAIARNIMEMATFTVPVICIVIGEGGSGGALAIGVGNRVLMMENSIYSVISPEGCAAILWRDRAEGPKAAAALRITAEDCARLGVADDIVPEPACGAHRDHAATMAALDPLLDKHLTELMAMSPDELRQDRYDRFRQLGKHVDPDG
ncbi:MAG: acetyl-CoA carboxylase carboxyltransferase subunit alpha [Proteobacteria bacterium]|nr:acetyl-CoA carboxylase carboxyltransferase subunit alpha [Pseudomonadota bacterium]MCP4915742.1 acetyl-CoA carboxylase carboxyltransferase subunit alpha [Pseudomonadota bacterium]